MWTETRFHELTVGDLVRDADVTYVITETFDGVALLCRAFLATPLTVTGPARYFQAFQYDDHIERYDND